MTDTTITIYYLKANSENTLLSKYKKRFRLKMNVICTTLILNYKYIQLATKHIRKANSLN